MAFAKIEPTGCIERKGKVRLRFSYYLEPNDARYEEHRIYAPIIPESGIPEGLKDDAYSAWLDSLPHEWRDNPFHNHFTHFDADTPDAKIKQVMEDTLETFYGAWSKGEKLSRVAPINRAIPKPEEAKKSKGKVRDIVKRATEFEVAYGRH